MVETAGITTEQWESVVARLSEDDRVSKSNLGFVKLIDVQGLLGETLYLQVANEMIRGIIEQRVKQPLLEALQTLGLPQTPTNIGIVINPGLADSFSAAIQQEVEEEAPVAPAAAEPVKPVEGSSKLNPRYTFESFVQGESNRFAFAAAFAVAEVPAKAYNPLFIYGNSGLGKTHLLHAIGNYVQEYWPNKRVRYVSSEVFTNDFINAIQTNTSFNFQAKYRQIDVLLIDDIQFLQGKKETQDSFFATFNALHESGKQVVITSDVSPKLLNSFDERMRSRFEWGLMVGSFLGESLGFYLGRVFGGRIRSSKLGLRIPQKVWHRADAFVESRGGLAIAMSRFLPVLHSVVPLTAGMTKMSYRTFITWTAGACAIWTSVYLGIGWFARGATAALEKDFKYGGAILIGIIVLFLIVVSLVKKRIEKSADAMIDETEKAQERANKLREAEIKKSNLFSDVKVDSIQKVIKIICD